MEKLSSSPDPLNDSPTFYSPRKTRRATKPRQSLPACSSSPTKQTFELDVGNRLSPQKLIVTVEAESEGGFTRNTVGGHQSSPSRRLNKTRERTITTIIPVKGLSDSEDEPQAEPTPKRGRGRPRKSTGTPVPAKKGRNSTPTRRKSIGDLVDGDDENDINFQVGKNVEIGRGKGKSRSRSTKGATRKSTPAPEEDDQSVIRKARGRPRRKSFSVDDHLVREESNAVSIDEDAGQPAMSDASQPTEANSAPSEYSTIRSTTTVGWGEPQIIARFDPGNETPRAAGWSSPRVVESTTYFGNNPTASSEDRRTCPSQEYVTQQDEEEFEEDDELGELREFDTILESEEFSMISVDSVPSLRNLSSPAVPEVKPLVRPKNKSLESLKKATTDDDSFSSIPEEVLIAATPARKIQSRNLFVPDTVDNSFSSIPPEILAAAPPAKKTHLSNFQSAKSNADDSFSSVAPEILQAATPARMLPKSSADASRPISTMGNGYSKMSDTTSHAPHSAIAHSSKAEPQTEPERSSGPEQRRIVSASYSTTSRLPTPPDGSSSPEFEEKSPTTVESATKNSGIVSEATLMHSYMPSSPPVAARRRFTYTAHLRRQSQLQVDLTQTPSIVFSSPSLPPPIIGQREQPALKTDSSLELRPALSPVARAGQALQDIIVPSSPRNRSSSLGSPFKSPAADRKFSFDSRDFLPSPSQERGIKHLPRLDLNNNLFPGSHLSSRSQVIRQDDPFRSSGATQQRSPSPEDEAKPYTLGVPMSRGSGSKVSTIKSADVSMNEDAMSWQAEEELPVPAMRSEETLEQKWAKQRTAVSKKIGAAAPEQVIVINSDHDDKRHDEGEDFDLLLETINSSSPVSAPQEQRPAYVEKPRRSKIPSPWRTNSKRLVYSDELSHFSSPTVGPVVPALKPLRGIERSQPVTVQRVETPLLSDEVDPANVSNWQIPQKSNFQPRSRETGGLDLSAILSPVKPLPILPRETRPSAFQSTSTSSAELQNIVATEPKETLAAAKSKRDDPFAPIAQKAGFNPTPRNSSPLKDTTNQGGLFKHLPKTRLFTPSAEDSSSSKTQSQDRSPLTLKTTQALNTQPQQTPETVSSLLYSTESTDVQYPILPSTTFGGEKEKENTNPDARTLKWTQSLHLATKIIQTPLPPRTVSPTKSCFRTPVPLLSPTKNVQFVSSSPVPSEEPTQVLSATQWSKDHWLLLDEIRLAHQAQHDEEMAGQFRANVEVKRRRNSTRVISKLLGKKVSSQGEEMFFEQWHLEVLDEFRGRVPGWEEKVIAMRVFALVKGEERRALGKA